MKQATGVRAHPHGLPLDVRVGVRLLVKHKWLTVVGTVAIAFAIGIGVNAFEFFTQMVRPKLPLEAGGRIVGIMMSDVARARDKPPTLHDLSAWQDGLKSVQDLAAFRTLNLNLVVGNGAPEPVKVAEISAAAFRVARVRPLLGRALVPADERPGTSSHRIARGPGDSAP
jgi:putative ABC transport system permease protein